MIFTFGSNLAGRHGAGAALTALKYHGAEWGRGIGPHGHSYAIPTKDFDVKTPLKLEQIQRYVDDFIDYANNVTMLGFQITRIGCGLAGYKDEEIAPLFLNAPKTNCFFDSKWRPFLGNEFEYWGTYG